MRRARHVTFPRWRYRSERGAIIIHVGIALLVLIAFSSFAVDQGVRLVSRNQAQNGADAGAMAAAIALGLDDFDDRSASGPAVQAGQQFALMHAVWGAPPDVTPADVTFPACPDDGSNACVRVDVYRNQARGNPLPSYFGQLVGVTDQGVRATATAKSAIANASDCLKPWAIQDKWNELRDPSFDVDSTYDVRFKSGPNSGDPLPTPPPLDEYMAPTTSGPGTGYSLPADIGQQVTLKAGGSATSLSPGHFLPIDLPLPPDGGCTNPTGGACYRYNIASCNGNVIAIGDSLTLEPGNMIGPTQQGVSQLIALDPTAWFDTATNTVQGSCAPSCAPLSPRIVAIPVFDTEAYDLGKASGRTDVTIANILGFFVASMQGNTVVGYLTTIPGLLTGGGPGVGNGSAFQRVSLLIR